MVQDKISFMISTNNCTTHGYFNILKLIMENLKFHNTLNYEVSPLICLRLLLFMNIFFYYSLNMRLLDHMPQILWW